MVTEAREPGAHPASLALASSVKRYFVRHTVVSARLGHPCRSRRRKRPHQHAVGFAILVFCLPRIQLDLLADPGFAISTENANEHFVVGDIDAQSRAVSESQNRPAVPANLDIRDRLPFWSVCEVVDLDESRAGIFRHIHLVCSFDMWRVWLPVSICTRSEMTCRYRGKARLVVL